MANIDQFTLGEVEAKFFICGIAHLCGMMNTKIKQNLFFSSKEYLVLLVTVIPVFANVLVEVF